MRQPAVLRCGGKKLWLFGSIFGHDSSCSMQQASAGPFDVPMQRRNFGLYTVHIQYIITANVHPAMTRACKLFQDGSFLALQAEHNQGCVLR